MDYEDLPKKEITPEKVIKHPLQYTWTMWFFKLDQNKSWEDSQTKIASFSTIEDFWSVYNYLIPASGLKTGCDYSLFKSGIKPMWEDKNNRNGGRWLIALNKNQRYDLDSFWMDVVLMLIGEAFDECSEELCGSVVNVRARGDKIAIWTANAKNRESNLKIGTIWKNETEIDTHMTVGYQAHKHSMVKTGSMAKNMYTV